MKVIQKQAFLEGVPIVHPIVPEGRDQSRALRRVCGGRTHHPVLRPRSVCTSFPSKVVNLRGLPSLVMWRGLRDVGTEVQACSSTKAKQGWVSYYW